MKKNILSENDDWTYEDSLDGYGPATKHVWINSKLDCTVQLALSEGMHIMKCERGEWLVTINIGGGKTDQHYCFETEEEALDNIKDLIPTQ
jgi:hypothetical protein